MKEKLYPLSHSAVTRFLVANGFPQSKSYASRIRGMPNRQGGFVLSNHTTDGDALVVRRVLSWTSIAKPEEVCLLGARRYAEALRARYDVELIESGEESHVVVRAKPEAAKPEAAKLPTKATTANVWRWLSAHGQHKAISINMPDRKYTYTPGVLVTAWCNGCVRVAYRDGVPGKHRFPEKTKALAELLSQRFEVDASDAENDRLIVKTKGQGT